MKYKQFVYTAIFTIITTLKFTVGNDELNESRKFHAEKFFLDPKIVSNWNKTSFTGENSVHFQNENPGIDSEYFENQAFSQNFPNELNKCIADHQYQITDNYNSGKNIILNCFKAALILNLGKYLIVSPKSSIKLFNGLVELKKVPDIACRESGDNVESSKCNKYNRLFERLSTSENKKNEYIKMYKKAMEKLVNENSRFRSYRNMTEAERINQLNRINEGSQAFLSEVIRNIDNEEAEKIEEEKLQKEISDPKLLNVLDAFSKNYMLKLKFYPGIAARMQRSHNGGVTFDLEINEPEEDTEENGVSDEVSTREIKSSKKKTKGKDYFDDDDDGGNKKRKKSKKRKKEAKKKVKKMKKIIPYLLLPILIQMTLLPFVFKKLFFLAMKALFAGKVALILIGFQLLRNTCVNQEDKYAQRIRVEHYGYNKGEEYGAWVNGRSIQEPEMMSALSEAPFGGQKPVTS